MIFDHLFRLLLKTAVAKDPILAGVKLRYCSAADKEHRQSWRQFMHAWHFPGVICSARAVESLDKANQVGLIGHEIGHAHYLLRGEEHSEASANKKGGELIGYKITFKGPNRLEYAVKL